MARVPGKQIKYSRELKLRKKLTIKKRALRFSGFANLANLWFGSSLWRTRLARSTTFLQCSVWFSGFVNNDCGFWILLSNAFTVQFFWFC